MKRVYRPSDERSGELTTLSVDNMSISNKWKRTAWVPAVVGIAITGITELINYYVPGFNQAVCGLLGLAPAAAGILISRAQVNAAKDLNQRANKGLNKSISNNIVKVEGDQGFTEN